MPRGPAQPYRARKQPVSDHYILAAIDKAGGPGKHDAQGHYGVMVIKELKDRDEAEEWHHSLYRCALWLTRNRKNLVGNGISVSQADIQRDGTEWKIIFRITDKVHGRKYQLENRGTDRSKWFYNPRPYRRGAA